MRAHRAVLNQVVESDGETSGAEPVGRVASVADATAAAEGVALERIRRNFDSILHESGVHDALGYVNERTRYRFTSLFRFEPPLLRDVCSYDRENPSLRLAGGAHALDETYCSIVRATGMAFTTADAPRDRRLAGHPARGRVLSYLGVPIRLVGGTLAGVLCHHDVRPRLPPAGEIRVLEQIAPALALWLVERREQT